MAKHLIRLQPYKEIMKCNKCGSGEMKSTGVVLTSKPQQYQHKCNNPANKTK